MQARSETSFDDTFGTIPESSYVSGRILFYKWKILNKNNEKKWNS